MYIRALIEPFSPAEAIEIETGKCSLASAAKDARKITSFERAARAQALTPATKQKR
jgi:hypothetical protein